MQITEIISGQKPQSEKQLEKDRYIQAQINILQSKLQRLERIFSFGMPLAEAEETIDRLDQLDTGMKTIDSKVQVFATVLKELKTEQEKLVTSMDEKATMKQISMLSQRIKYLENIYGELSSSKTKDIFMNIVEIMKSMENRVKSLEDISHKNVSLLFERDLTKVKKEVVKSGAKPGEIPVEGEEATESSSAGPGMAQETKQEGRLKRFFRKLFGK